MSRRRPHASRAPDDEPVPVIIEPVPGPMYADGTPLARGYIDVLRPIVAVLAACVLAAMALSAQDASRIWIAAALTSFSALVVSPLLIVVARRIGYLRVALAGLCVDLVMSIAITVALDSVSRATVSFVWAPLLGALMLRFRPAVTLTLITAVARIILTMTGTLDHTPRQALFHVVLILMLGIGTAWLRDREFAARREMASAHRQLRYAQRLVHLGSWEWDATSRRAYWSDELFRMFGISPSVSPTFSTFLELVVEPDRDSILTLVRAAAGEGVGYRFDATIRPVGSTTTRIVEVIGTPASELGHGNGRYYGTIQDVTEQRRLDAMKSEFVATASHELRTPAAIIIGFASTLRHQWERLGEGQRVAFVGEIERAGMRLNDLIEDVLQVSRIEAGLIECAREPFDVLNEVRSLLAHWPSAPRPRLVIDDALAGAGIPTSLVALGDAKRTMQVLTNLVTNAEVHTPRGTNVRIEVRADARTCRIEVVDDGPGVPAEDRDRIFDRFVRLDTVEHGTGLGLYISRRLMDAQGGSLTLAEHAGGEGARFVVELPRYNTSSSTSSG